MKLRFSGQAGGTTPARAHHPKRWHAVASGIYRLFVPHGTPLWDRAALVKAGGVVWWLKGGLVMV